MDDDRLRRIVREEVVRAMVGPTCPECGIRDEMDILELEQMTNSGEEWEFQCGACGTASPATEWEPDLDAEL